MDPVNAVSEPRVRARMSLLLLLVLFAAPVVLAWLAFYVFPEWRPSATANHGELIEPLRPLPPFQLETLAGKSVDESFVRGKWTLVYLMQGACTRPCVDQLFRLRQVRLAQGKNIDRVQRLILWDTTGVSPAKQAELDRHFPGQVLLSLEGRQSQALLNAFALDGQDPLQTGRVYLADPLGNLMMSYGAEADPRGMIEDLERLLKYSGLG
jgi:hypothetical protein